MRRMTTAAAVLVTLALLLAACSSGAQTSTGGGGGDGVQAGGGEGGEEGEDGEAPTSPPTTRAPRHFTISGVGDILLHNYVIQNGKANAGAKGGYDFNPMFDEVRDIISASDISLCHMETPISADNTQLTVPRTLSFNAPKEIAAALKNAGFDGCSTGSNHTYDRQLKGVKDTLDVMDEAGLKHAGSSRDQGEADSPPIYEANGVKVGHLAFSYTIYNDGGPSQRVPPEAPWLKTMLWPAVGVPGIIEQAKAVKARGAEFVVVSMHWGDQYISQPNAQQRQMAKDLLASPDIDLILGDHVHVVQPCEKIGDKYVTYGMGNFLSNQSPYQDSSLIAATQDGTIQTFTVDEVQPNVFRVTKMVYTPTFVVIPPHRIEPSMPPEHKPSYDRTFKAMTLLGPGACDATPAF